jgi:NAD-dependent deacetylase sirtuin 5
MISLRALKAQPNAAHIVLAKLSIPSVLEKVAPAAQSFHLITQNVDGLSERALQAVDAVQRSKSSSPGDYPQHDSLIEMHGRLFDLRCTVCSHTVLDFSMPLCPALGKADEGHTDVIAAGNSENALQIPTEELPKCAECGSLARPGVVWFGEDIPLLPKIDKLVEQADLCLVVGTSSTVRLVQRFSSSTHDSMQVQPAASFADEVQ